MPAYSRQKWGDPTTHKIIIYDEVEHNLTCSAVSQFTSRSGLLKQNNLKKDDRVEHPQI